MKIWYEMFERRHLLYEAELNIYIFFIMYTITFEILLVYNDKKRLHRRINKNMNVYKFCFYWKYFKRISFAMSKKIFRVYFKISYLGGNVVLWKCMFPEEYKSAFACKTHMLKVNNQSIIIKICLICFVWIYDYRGKKENIFFKEIYYLYV